MKKRNSFILLLGTVLCFSQTVVHAADGTINFTGQIVATTCDVNGGSTASINVDLGTVAATSFTAAGDTSSPTAFTISLTNCPTTFTAAAVKFDGTADAVDNQLLEVTGGATGVGIEIADNQGTPIPLYTASRFYPIDATAEGVDMNFIARYKSTEATVGEGEANGTSQFTINYQ
ncbi:fimbrial protein [Rahnella sp. PAMC25617]|jgi:major type 1 subunit fimbrin (pilin)|uniref:fimbrial protein n=1 Tax=Rahnella TaxID=34037 RepID=UPI000DE8396B|nr:MULTISPECIES: fimbrial protein [Rahnella]RBQ35776.1 fimbrial protein [Rahnella aquatilis]RYJ12088.1 type 1 fimbrial protein [Rahnella variigena]TCQ85701.1 major type 1 subunit fimbrin (pilin) [Rahnella sp. JUb53]